MATDTENPLFLADTIEKLEALKAEGADFTKRSSFDSTALHLAVDNPQVANWLLENTDIDINARDKAGKTALHYAVSGKRNGEVAKLLVERKANVNALDNKDVTPLQDSLQYNGNPAVHMQNAKLLIENGAKVNWYTKEFRPFRTAMDMKPAQQLGKEWTHAYRPIQQYLESQGGKHYDDISLTDSSIIEKEMRAERAKGRAH